MRNKSLKVISLLLTASLALSSVNTGVSALAAGLDNTAIEQQTTKATDTEETEEAGKEATTEQSKEITTEQITEAAATEQTEETEETVPAEITTEQTTEENKDLIEEKTKKKQASAEDLVKNLIPDAVLRAEIISIYNMNTGSIVTDSNFTYAQLSTYTGDLVFGPASVKSIKGLGNAKQASSIDISAFNQITTIPANEFEGCAFTTFLFSDSIKNIESQAFYECSELTEITLPDTLSILGKQAFASCSKLSSVNSTAKQNTLPSGLTQLKEQAFLDDVSLSQIEIPSFTDGRILQDEPSIFSGCKSLESITIGQSITTIPASMFMNAGINSENGASIKFEAGSKLDKILGGAFSGAKIQTTVDLSMCEDLTAIEGSTFEAATGLTTVILPIKSSGTLSFGNKVFAKTALITMNEKGKTTSGEIVLPDYVAQIGEGCFYGNTDMTHISLSPKLPAIPDYTFDGCKALVTIEQRQQSGTSQVKEIGDCAFRSTAITNTEFLMKMNQLETIGYQKLDQVSKYGIGTSKTNEEEILSIGVGGVTDGMSVLDKETHQKWNASKKKYYGSEVFTNCTDLTTVTLPSSVKNIGGRAFYFIGYDQNLASNIESVTWASSTAQNVERAIYAEAFHGNGKMTTMILPENKNAGESLTIGAYAFYGDGAMSKVGVDSQSTNVLPSSLKKLEEGAFYYCKAIKNITIQSTESGTCPELGIKVFEKCLTLQTATVPKETTKIPRHFFYDVPLKSFQVGDNSSIAIKEIGALAFFGNAFTTLDLSNYTALEEIDGGVFAAVDTLIEPEEPSKSRVAIYPESIGGGVLTTVVLPSTLSHDMVLNSATFTGQGSFNTMKIPGGMDGQVYMPDYLVELDSQGLFGSTGISKVVWQADTTGKNQWETIPVSMFSGCPYIIKAEDVLPKGNYVKAIGKAAFKQSGIRSANLSAYTLLTTIGWGTLSGTQEFGAFQSCGNLTSITLPKTVPGVKLIVGEKTFKESKALKDVDFGNAAEVQKEAFDVCEGLQSICFSNTLTKLGQGAFRNCILLTTIDFGSLKEIGNNCFENCTSLVLTESGLPDSLETIGQNAFKKAEALGEVRFGPGLKKIDNYAFYQSGVTKFDFNRASNLETIGQRAFAEIATLNTFKLENTKVEQVEAILYGCVALTSASFGDELLYIKRDSLAGCKNLSTFSFASTTTVSNEVFYSTYKNEYTANAGNITINVTTPKKTVIPTGRTVTLPYYINEKTFSQFDYILVGNLNSTETVKEYLQVGAKLNDGYYWKQQSNKDGDMYKVTEAAYYTPLAETASIKRPVINRDIDVIQVKGLKPTQGSIDFSITCSLSFKCQPAAGNIPKTVTATKFSAKYQIEVKDVPFYADLYTNNNRLIGVPHGGTDNIQVINSTKYKQYYFNIENAEPVDCTPTTYDVVVETDNPDVMYPSNSGSGKKQSSYTTTRGTNVNSTTKVITPNKSSQNFYLVEAGVGTANIKVYPKGYPEFARTYTYVVNSDIQSIALMVPKEYNSGAAPGAVFPIFSNYKNYFGQMATAADMSNYSHYSNRQIIYTSDAPDYVSVDSLGVVRVLKADANVKRVKITATVPTGIAGRVVSTNATINVKYPDTKVNETVVDAGTGSTVAVAKVSKKDLEGEAKFVKPNTKATTVTIPDTVTINGVKYKVTTVAANAFKNNSKITTVKLGKYVKQIEANAFYNCKKLKTVSISSKGDLTEIGKSAFQNCSALTKITIPVKVTKIGSKAFYNCKKLKTVSISSKANIMDIGNNAFQNCYKLTKITIPVKVTKIGSKAFYNCKKLKRITVKSTVLNTVGKNAFRNIHKKAIIKVPKKKLAMYKTLLKGKGQKKSVKIRK